MFNNKYINEVLANLDASLDAIESNIEDILIKAEKGIEVSKKSLKDIRKWVINHQFESKNDEIHFFKYIKPRVYSKLKYYVILFNVESKRPRGSSKSQIDYFNCEISKLQVYFNDNLDFYHYYRRGATNTFRSDHPYRDLGNNGEAGPNSLVSYIKKGGKNHNDFFEPFNNKPLVARATLYFFIAHKGKIKSQNYDVNAIETLKEWSKLKKPSNYELHRNEAIFKIQGNRNPFIDFPEWVDKVDFMQGIIN